MTEIVDISISAGDAEFLTAFTRQLVDDRLVACGSIIPGVRSIYQWNGQVMATGETLVILHTRAALVPDIIARADAEHPDDTPQVLAVPVAEAHPGYAQWVIDSTS